MLKNIINSTSRKMKIDFEEITSEINHQGLKGTEREEIVKDFLEKYLPQKYSISEGTIINSENKQSKQTDVIVHDNLFIPSLEFRSSKMIPVESVFATIEVKSTLTKSELQKSINNIKSFKELNLSERNAKAGFVFAYSSDSSLQRVRDNLSELSKDLSPRHKINCICILDKGIIISLDSRLLTELHLTSNNDVVYATIDNNEDSLLIFYLLLLEYINNISIELPRMIEYAEAGELIQREMVIPQDEITDNSMVQFGETVYNMGAVKDMLSLTTMQQKFENGELNENELLDFVYETVIKSNQLMGQEQSLTFLGANISNKNFINLEKIKNDIPLNSEEKRNFDNFRKWLFKYYQENINQEKNNHENQSSEGEKENES